jgi:hypothetical protein
LNPAVFSTYLETVQKGSAMNFYISAAIIYLALSQTLTTDPLTGLPITPATDTHHFGNEPTQMPESTVCKSKFRGNFYGSVDSKVDATVAWYTAHLPGFKKIHGYSGGRSQDAFYNSNGTLVVIVTGDPGKEGENEDTYSVSYEKYEPGLPEKTITGLTHGNLTCP